MLYFTNIKPLEVLLPDLRRRKATEGSVRLSKYGIKVNPKTPRNQMLRRALDFSPEFAQEKSDRRKRSTKSNTGLKKI